MKIRGKKNYYELLDITPGATRDDIEEAYSRARKVYGEDSSALYSLYSSQEREAMLDDIKEAYETLRDPIRKRSYDTQPSGGGDEIGDVTLEVDINALRSKEPSARKDLVVFSNSVKVKEPLIVMGGSEPMIAEQYRVLYTGIEQISQKNGGQKAFAVTSAVKGEGKSTTSINLAYLMAHEFKKRTVLVECDMRKTSSLIPFLYDCDKNGLQEVLRGEADYTEAVRRVEDTLLHVLPAGVLAKRSSEMLSSQELKTLIRKLRADFDYVIMDSPPVLPLVDMNIVSKLVDGVIMVVRAGKTPKDIVMKAINTLGQSVAGIVLNGADTKLKKYYY